MRNKVIQSIDLNLFTSEIKKKDEITEDIFTFEQINRFLLMPLDQALSHEWIDQIDELISFCNSNIEEDTEEHEIKQFKKKLITILLDSNSFSNGFVGVF
ncbi:MAG: hypothetical protein IBX70_11780 [Clostridia bacterium]|nr:hypothetical protein [Clostridia bacterium]